MTGWSGLESVTEALGCYIFVLALPAITRFRKQRVMAIWGREL